MDKQTFESSISKFLEKAGVLFLKKGADYPDSNTCSNYILLDEKRKSFYFTELDIEHDDTSLSSAIEQFIEDVSMPENAVYALLSAGRAFKNHSTRLLPIEGKNLEGLTPQCSIVLDAVNSQSVSDFLTSRNITFQAVPNKDSFTIVFINTAMSQKLVDIYDEYFPDFPSFSSTQEEEPISPVFSPVEDKEGASPSQIQDEDGERDPLKPIVEPRFEEELSTVETDEETQNNQAQKNVKINAETSTNQEESKEENLNTTNVDNNNQDEDISTQTTNQKEENTAGNQKTAPSKENSQASDDELNPDEEEMLDNIDLSDLLTPKKADDDEPKDEAEADLLYGKLLKEQADKISITNTAHAAKSIKDVPEGIFDENDLKEAAVNLKENNENKKNKKQKEDKISSSTNDSDDDEYKSGRKFYLLSVPGKAMADCVALFFFFPAYIINKIARKFLPKFVIYWIASLAAIFGAYQIVFSTFLSFHYDNIETYANDTINLMINYTVPEGKELNKLEALSVNMISQGAPMFSGELNIISKLQSEWLLHFLISFASIMMIIPAFRRIGKTLTIFAVAAYFVLPVIVWMQCYLINMASTLASLNNSASVVYFAVYFLPVLSLLFVLYISSAIVPDENKHREVLP